MFYAQNKATEESTGQQLQREMRKLVQVDSGVPYEGGAYPEVHEEGTTLPDDDYLWQDYERDEPPEALDWSKLENCIRYLSEDEERRARRLLATGLFSRSQFTQYVQARLTCKFGEHYPFLRFDHALGWDEDYKKGFAAWCVAVMPRQWENDWRTRVARYAMEGEV